MLNFGRFTLYLLVTFALMPVQVLAVARGWTLALTLPVAYHRLVCRIFGIELVTRGTIGTDRPTLFVSNHGSYIDIAILGALIPGSFIAKSEVAGWPLFGVLAKLQRTVFVDREVRSSARQRDSLVDRLTSGDNLILFPEGTSNDGNRLKPFKSALFSAAAIQVDGRAIAVQPVCVSYTRLNGLPLGRGLRPLIAWYGDMALVSHMWRLIGLGRLQIEVQFLEPVTIARFGSRKKLSEYCEAAIADCLAATNAGRAPAPTQPPTSEIPERSAA
jgi:1-acyl-sn-glycerol-3-phosphate acyltransferase